jgi:hypothetical protein
MKKAKCEKCEHCKVISAFDNVLCSYLNDLHNLCKSKESQGIPYARPQYCGGFSKKKTKAVRGDVD